MSNVSKVNKATSSLFTSFTLFTLFTFLPGCASNKALTTAVELREDLMTGRLVDVVRSKKVLKTKNFLIFKQTKYANFLEGYIQGVITDYNDNPVAGVEVRAEAAEGTLALGPGVEEQILAEEEGAQSSTISRANFDPGSTDANGIYRVRFSLPVIKGRVDVRGKLLYNPSWGQQHDVLGQAYEPQAKESEFRLFYDEDLKMLVLSEGTRKTIVRPVRNSGKASSTKLPGSGKPETVGPDKNGQKKKPEDDFFKNFQFGQ